MGEICVLYRNDGFTVWIVWFCLNTELRACLFPLGSAFRPSFGGPIEASSLFLNEDYFFILSLWIHKVSHRFSQRGAWDVSNSRISRKLIWRPCQSADISSLYMLHIFQRRQKYCLKEGFYTYLNGAKVTCVHVWEVSGKLFLSDVFQKGLIDCIGC